MQHFSLDRFKCPSSESSQSWLAFQPLSNDRLPREMRANRTTYETVPNLSAVVFAPSAWHRYLIKTGWNEMINQFGRHLLLFCVARIHAKSHIPASGSLLNLLTPSRLRWRRRRFSLHFIHLDNCWRSAKKRNVCGNKSMRTRAVFGPSCSISAF